MSSFQERAETIRNSLNLDDLQTVEEAMMNDEICSCQDKYVVYDGEMHIINATSSTEDCCACRREL